MEWSIQDHGRSLLFHSTRGLVEASLYNLLAGPQKMPGFQMIVEMKSPPLGLLLPQVLDRRYLSAIAIRSHLLLKLASIFHDVTRIDSSRLKRAQGLLAQETSQKQKQAEVANGNETELLCQHLWGLVNTKTKLRPLRGHSLHKRWEPPKNRNKFLAALTIYSSTQDNEESSGTIPGGVNHIIDGRMTSEPLRDPHSCYTSPDIDYDNQYGSTLLVKESSNSAITSTRESFEHHYDEHPVQTFNREKLRNQEMFSHQDAVEEDVYSPQPSLATELDQLVHDQCCCSISPCDSINTTSPEPDTNIVDELLNEWWSLRANTQKEIYSDQNLVPFDSAATEKWVLGQLSHTIDYSTVTGPISEDFQNSDPLMALDDGLPAESPSYADFIAADGDHFHHVNDGFLTDEVGLSLQPVQAESLQQPDIRMENSFSDIPSTITSWSDSIQDNSDLDNVELLRRPKTWLEEFEDEGVTEHLEYGQE
ncbi:uncharacterized protein CTRU02_203807 [Colletotrichum truncatum]|uniref:Uncharacterized protein n=1 Tax=Colletotrichum truncatum TaxID=5467 RepID=A0ACC3ZAC0_COLTU|nr:uncharacterized protein CTRU02_04137 [Colletotrichum truncatum]KAF6796177.1 hypothetical protein CTRU02_04137 [Colletotrichum truncatum]